MSKFHDEFFRQGSPVHDALMIKCLSKDGIGKILSAVGNFEIKPPKITGVVCTTQSNSIFTEMKKCDLFDANGNCKKIYKCPLHLDCEYNEPQLHPNQFQPARYKPIKADEITISGIVNVVHLIKKETEVIIKNGHFILGYADAIISEELKAIVKYVIPDGWIVKEAVFPAYRTTIVEAKPEITSIGEVIRQLKTYASLIGDKDTHMVIVTYSKLGEDALEYLANENIIVVQFDRA